MFKPLLLLLHVALAVLILLLDSILSLLLRVGLLGGAILAQPLVVIICPLPLTIVVGAFLLHSLLLNSVLKILRFQVTLKLPKLSLDLILTILANHFNRAESIFGLSQFVLFLLLWVALVRRIDALIDTSTVSLANLEVLVTALRACGCTARVCNAEVRLVH